MTNKIDQLRTEVNNIRNALDELKNDVALAEEEKKRQARELKAQAEDAKQEIVEEIHSLESKTDAESIKQKEEAELLLDSFTEITNLYNSIINSSDTPAPAPESASDTKPAEEKGFFGKIWDWTKEKSGATWSWIGDQWDAVWDKGKWERGPEGYKNTLRAAGFLATGVGAIALTYKGVKKLWKRAFSSDDEEEAEAETETKTKSKSKKKKKKKPFWDRWYGKALKWGLITTAGVFGAKWLLEKLDLIGVDEDNPTDDETSEVKYEAFDKLPEDVKEIYNKLGDNVDKVYQQINKRELDAGFQDEITLDRTAQEVGKNLNYTGIIPFCLDNKFGSVEELLGQNAALKWNLQRDFRGVIDWIKDQGRDVLEIFAKQYLSKLGFGIGNLAGNALANAIKKWAESDEERQREIKLFYRQSMRIERYFFGKKKQLEEKLAENNGLGKTRDEIMKDDELYDVIIGNNPDYQSFLTGNISTAISILEKYELLDDNPGEDTEKIVGELDGQRDEITGDSSNDIARKIYEKEDTESVTAEEKERLKNACEKMQEDIKNKITPALEHSPIRMYEEVLGGSDNTEIKEFITKGGVIGQLTDNGNTMAQLVGQIDQLDTKGIKTLAESLNIFLALKKEILMGADTIDNENHNYFGSLYKLTCAANNQIIGGFKKIRNGKFLDGAIDIAAAAPVVLLEIGTIEVMIGGVRCICTFGNKGKKLVVNGIKTGGYIPYLVIRWSIKGGKAAGRAYSSIRGKVTPPNLADDAVRAKFIDDVKIRKKPLSQASDEVIAYMIKHRKESERIIAELGLDWQSVEELQDPLYIQKKLIDKAFGDSERLRALKQDKALYERAIRHFNNCDDVKTFLTGEGDMNDLRRVLDAHEKNIIEQARRTPEGFSKKCTEVWEGSDLKKVFDAERTRLEQNLQTKEEAKGRAKSRKAKAKANGELEAARRELDKLDSIEKEVKRAMSDLENTNPRNLKNALNDLLGDTKKVLEKMCASTGSDIIRVMRDVNVLNGLVDTVKDANGNRVFNSIDDLLNKLNGSYIDELKNTYKVKFQAATEARLRTIADNISDIRLRNAVGLVDDAMTVMKRIFRIGSRLSRVL